jgi:hypothetical protein
MEQQVLQRKEKKRKEKKRKEKKRNIEFLPYKKMI